MDKNQRMRHRKREMTLTWVDGQRCLSQLDQSQWCRDGHHVQDAYSQQRNSPHMTAQPQRTYFKKQCEHVSGSLLRTQQVGALIHVPNEPRPRRRQLFKQGVRVAVERHVLNALSRSADTGKGIVSRSVHSRYFILLELPAGLVSNEVHIQLRGGLNDVLHICVLLVLRQP